MPATVVLIGESSSGFYAPLQKQYTTYFVRSGVQGIDAAREHDVDAIVLDAASLGTTGVRICRTLRKAFPDCHIIHVYPSSKKQIDSPADILLAQPITARALINAIEHLVSGRDTQVLRCGPFALDIERNILLLAGKEVILTPKQTELTAIFLRHPNKTLDRKWLMQQVWNTDYTGDTRTLSVHIRYVREAMEKNPSQPRYLKTVRGSGYRLEVIEK